MKKYKITTADEKVTYTEGDAEKILQSLLGQGVKFVDIDGRRLHILVSEVPGVSPEEKAHNKSVAEAKLVLAMKDMDLEGARAALAECHRWSD